MKSNYLNLLIIFTFCGLLSSCMGLEEGRPSRVALMNVDGEEVESLTLLQGMSYRFYPGVFLPTEEGEAYEGPAVRNPFLGDVEFVLDQGSGLMTVGKEGCVMAHATGLAQNQFGSVELLADSIHKGILKSAVAVTLKPLAVGGSVSVVRGISDFSVAQLRQKKKEAHYGVLTAEGNNKTFFRHINAEGILQQAQPADLGGSDAGRKVSAWTHLSRGDFFLSFAKFSPAKPEEASIVIKSYSPVIRRTQTSPFLVDATSSDVLNFTKLFGGELEGSGGIVFGTYLDAAKYKIYLFGSSSRVSAGPLVDPKKTNATQDKDLVMDADAASHVQFQTSYRGNSYLAVSRLEGAVRKITVVSLTSREGLKIEEVANSDHDKVTAFAFDASLDIPKLLIIQNGKIFLYRKLSDRWEKFPTSLGDANPDRKPHLSGNNEDGTVAAVWEHNGKYWVKISLDGGMSWGASPIEIQSASQNIDAASDLVDILALPCGSVGMLTIESQKKLFLRFVNILEKRVVSAALLNNVSAPDLKKIQLFKDDYRLKIFVMNQAGDLTALSLP